MQWWPWAAIGEWWHVCQENASGFLPLGASFLREEENIIHAV